MPNPAELVPALSIYRGDTFEKTLTLVKKIDGTITPVDLTLYGSEWSAQLRQSDDGPVAYTFDLDTSQASEGILVISLSSTVTAELPTKGVWDIQVTDTTKTPAYVRTLIRGSFARTKDVTR